MIAPTNSTSVRTSRLLVTSSLAQEVSFFYSNQKHGVISNFGMTHVS